MEANEIRINNLFLIKDKISVVYGIMTSSPISNVLYCVHNTEPVDISEINPIPLTPELLSKLDPKSNGKVWDIEGEFDVKFKVNTLGAFHASGIELREIKYLHELQNLFIDLYRRELNISEILHL